MMYYLPSKQIKAIEVEDATQIQWDFHAVHATMKLYHTNIPKVLFSRLDLEFNCTVRNFLLPIRVAPSWNSKH